jgi:hypothetical protein
MIKKLIWSLGIVLVLTSCSASYHYNRALKKGLKVEQATDTIQVSVVDSFPVIKNDTIVWEKFITKKDTIIKYNTIYVPKTRIEIRQGEKTERVRIKTEYKIIKSKDKVVIKTKKQEGWLRFFIGMVLGIFLCQVGKIIKYIKP